MLSTTKRSASLGNGPQSAFKTLGFEWSPVEMHEPEGSQTSVM